MTVVTGRTFKSGNSVAVRLPREIGLEAGTEVVITRSGSSVVISPKQAITGAELVRQLQEIGPPPDGVQKRNPIVFPKRSGL